jgi:hypothetical protein
MKRNYKYGILKDGELDYAPNKLIIENQQAFNATAEDYKANGYLPVIDTEAPQDTDEYYFVPYYVEEDGAIVQKWQQVEVPVIDEDEATIADYQ